MAVLHQQPRHCLGIDVAKNTIAISDGAGACTVANKRRAIRAALKAGKTDFVVCEP